MLVYPRVVFYELKLVGMAPHVLLGDVKEACPGGADKLDESAGCFLGATAHLLSGPLEGRGGSTGSDGGSRTTERLNNNHTFDAQ